MDGAICLIEHVAKGSEISVDACIIYIILYIYIYAHIHVHVKWYSKTMQLIKYFTI